MKGGYQILDLTGATAGSPVEVKGIYKAAAGNNGKPVLILTNDGQRVYAEIAEDGDDFVTCYVSAEGKTVNITIESDDSVTTVISDPGASITGLEQAVNEVNESIGDFGSYTLLATFSNTSYENITIDNIANYRYILLIQSNSAGQLAATSILPTGLFKNATLIASSSAIAANVQRNYQVIAVYVDNNTVRVAADSDYPTLPSVGLLYGIK